MKKRLLNFVLLFSMFATLIPNTVVSASAIQPVSDAVIDQRINELNNLLGGKYFTVNGTVCPSWKGDNHGCSNCNVNNVIKAKWFKNIFGTIKPSQMFLNGGMSCMGFVEFAEWYIYRVNNSDTVQRTKQTKYVNGFNYNTISQNAHIGDYIRVGGHSVILISADKSGINVLDCNWGNKCMVSIHRISYSKYAGCDIYISKMSSKSAGPSIPSTLTSTTSSGEWNITVPANHQLPCYSNSTDATSNGVYVDPQSHTYKIKCTQKAILSDGTIRYYGTFNTNDHYWFVYTNKMTVEDRTKPQTYTVTFNAGSGTVFPSSKTYTAGDTYGTLPTPTYPGYVFKGWLSVRDYTYATPSTTVPGSITLFARWEEEMPHTHQKGNVSTCENEHPHRNFYICSICGEQFTDGSTSYVDSCKICNPSDPNSTFDNLANWGHGAINAVNPPHTKHTKDNRIVSSAHPHYVFYTCSICGEVYTDNSKEAVSTCEECWGPWSDWTSMQVYPSEVQQVETRQIKTSDDYTEYRYGRYIDSTGRNNCWCAKYLESLSYVSGKATLQYSNWSPTRYYADGVGWTCGFCNGNHIGVDKVGADGRSWWAEYKLPGGDFYWEESRTVNAQYETQYVIGI